MKKIYICLLIVLLTLGTNAQTSHKKRHNHKNNPISIGLMAGVNHSTFIYNEAHLKPLPNNLFLRSNLGLFVDIPINEKLSIAPTFSLYSKGSLTKYVYEQNHNVTYTVKSKFLSTRIPIYYYFDKRLNTKDDIRPFLKTSNEIRPFVVIAPSYNYLLGGNINLSQPGLPIENVDINIGKANMNTHDLCVFLGGGISIKRFSLHSKVELGYNIGLINSYSKMEINETSLSSNINAYNINGKRFNHNIELNIYISLPIKKTDKECEECNKKYPKYSNSKEMKHIHNNAHKSFIRFDN